MKFSNSFKAALPAAILGFLTLGLAPTSAFAVTVTAPMAVSATVQATCIVSTTPMAFGTYTGSAVVSTSTLSVTCTSTTPYTLGLNAGTTASGTVASRLMTTGTTTMGYGLYTDAGHATNFATLASVNGTGTAQTTTVYGQIPAGEYVAPGSYADVITATVTY